MFDKWKHRFKKSLRRCMMPVLGLTMALGMGIGYVNQNTTEIHAAETNWTTGNSMRAGVYYEYIQWRIESYNSDGSVNIGIRDVAGVSGSLNYWCGNTMVYDNGTFIGRIYAPRNLYWYYGEQSISGTFRVSGTGRHYISTSTEVFRAYVTTTDLGFWINIPEKKHTITYNANGGSGNGVTDTVSLGKGYVTRQNMFTNVDKVFAGWNTKSDGSGTDWTRWIGRTWTWNYDYNITLYAQWKSPHNVTYKGNGGTYNGSDTWKDPKKVYIGSYYTTYSNDNFFTRDGYRFVGWNTKPDGSGTDWTGWINKPWQWSYDYDVTLYAQWQKIKHYNVNYNANGGSGSTASQRFTENENKSLSENGFKRAGHQFVGWNTQANGSGTSYANKQIVKNLTNVDESTVTLYAQWYATPKLKLYAQWTPIQYRIRYHGNGATSGSMDDQIFSYDETKTLTGNAFYNNGLKFKGWSTSSTGSVNYTDKQLVKNLSSTDGAIIDLYAVWDAKTTKTIVYNGNGATSGSTSSQAIMYTKTDTSLTKTFNKNGFTKSYYTFKGWNTKADGTGTSYKDQESFNVQNFFKNFGNNDSVTLYAQWDPYPYQVKYDANKGSGEMGTQDFVYDVAQNLYENQFTRYGYIFQGWSTSPNGSVQYKNKDNVKNLTTVKNGVVTLYAQWKPIRYTIRYHGNGATSGSMADMQMQYDEEKHLTKNVFKRESHIFNGWSTTPDGQGYGLVDQALVKNLTATNDAIIDLYAQWKPSENKTIPTISSKNAQYYIGDVVTKKDVIALAKAKAYDDDNKSYDVSGKIMILNMDWTDENGKTTKNVDPPLDGDATDVSGNKYDKVRKDLDTSEHGYYTVTYVVVDHHLNAVTSTSRITISSTYTVKFNGNAATSGTMKDQEFDFFDKKALSDNAFKKTGYQFNGWNTRADGKGTSYTNKQVVTRLLHNHKASMTLYAQWTPNTYTVRYNGNTATSGKMSDSQHVYDVAKKLNPNQYVKDGWKFVSWNTKADGTGARYTDQQSVINLTTVNKGIVTLYAQWNEAPKIKTKETYFFKNDTIPMTELLKYGKANDREQGDITTDMTIKTIQFGEESPKTPNMSGNLDTSREGTYTVVYTVTDNVGQTTTKKNKIYIVEKSDPLPPTIDENPKLYSRYIDKDYESTLEGHSKWKTDDRYSNALTSALTKVQKQKIKTWKKKHQNSKKYKGLSTSEKKIQMQKDCAKDLGFKLADVQANWN